MLNNLILNSLISQSERLANTFGWAISSVEIDSTYSGKAVMDIKPIVDETLGGASDIRSSKLDGGIVQSIFTPPPHQILSLPQLNTITLERCIIDAAYQLGAWDLCRRVHPKNYEALSVYFGGITNKTLIMDEPLMQSQQIQIIPDHIIIEADQNGFISWLFKPTSLASWWQKKSWISKDKTLTDDGTRSTAISIKYHNDQTKKHLYKFGVKNDNQTT